MAEMMGEKMGKRLAGLFTAAAREKLKAFAACAIYQDGDRMAVLLTGTTDTGGPPMIWVLRGTEGDGPDEMPDIDGDIPGRGVVKTTTLIREWLEGYEATPLDGFETPETREHLASTARGLLALFFEPQDKFDREYLRLSELGQCDSPGGAEHERVKAEWLAADRPTEITIAAFIRSRANDVPGSES